MYDVIIVGAGVTGAATAAVLGAEGRSVLLCDRGPLPAESVSTHFFGPSVLRFFDDLGLLDQLHATAPALRHWHLQLDDAYYGAPMLPRSSHPYNMCVRRRTLVDILLRHIASLPTVEVRAYANVQRLVHDGTVVTGVAGRGWQECGRVVVGADGRASRIADLVGAEMTFDAGTRRSTVHAYWSGVAPLPSPALELWHHGDALLQAGPCDGGLWVVMLSLPDADAAADTDYETALAAVPGMAARLRSAERVSPVYGSGRLRNHHRRPAGAGWRLAGDAYCHKDPLFGAGIADGCAAARALAESLDAEDPEGTYARLLDDRVGRRVREGMEGLRLEATAPGERAWVHAVLAHPGFALELKQHASTLFAGLPPDRRAFWQRAADQTAELLDLPAPVRIDGSPAPATAGPTAVRPVPASVSGT